MTPALHKAARNPPECDPTKEDCGCDGGEVTGVVSVAGTTRYALDKASRRTRIDSPAGTLASITARGTENLPWSRTHTALLRFTPTT